MTHTMHTKLPNKSAGSLLIPYTLHKYALRETRLEHTGLYCIFLLQSIHFSHIALHLRSLSIGFFILHYHLHLPLNFLTPLLNGDMKFLAITSHRCEES